MLQVPCGMHNTRGKTTQDISHSIRTLTQDKLTKLCCMIMDHKLVQEVKRVTLF